MDEAEVRRRMYRAPTPRERERWHAMWLLVQGWMAAARRTGAKIFFADEAHFQADADLRGKWVLKGEPALVGSTSPRRGEKVSYYSAVCLETGEVEVMELEGNSNSETSAAFLRKLRMRHAEPLAVIWDNSPAHQDDALRTYLTTPGLNLRLVNLPCYSPDSTPTRPSGAGCVRRQPLMCAWEPVPQYGKGWATFSPLWPTVGKKVKRRCRTILQARAAKLTRSVQNDPCDQKMSFSPWLGFSFCTKSRGLSDIQKRWQRRRSRNWLPPPVFRHACPQCPHQR